MKSLGRVLARLLLGCGLLAFAGGWSGCPAEKGRQACKNSADKCGASSSSSSGTLQDCIQTCASGIGSNSGSSGAAYRACCRVSRTRRPVSNRKCLRSMKRR